MQRHENQSDREVHLTRFASGTAIAAILTGLAAAALAQEAQPTRPPEPPSFPGLGVPEFVSVSDILVYKALPSYSEPDWVTEKFVNTGLLPPVEERLPPEPMVYLAGNMPDGIGVYGDVMRHVIGGRPEGWNHIAGQSQGWGGIDLAALECLTRTGPLFQIRAEELEPLPNLARSWEWSEDGLQLTMNLIEGARWSDGDPFDAEDVMFYWEDSVLDPNVTNLTGAQPDTFGVGTTLEALDDYTIRWTFTTPFPRETLYQMGYGNFCPGPAHMLKPHHPRYNPEKSYEDFRTAFPAEYMNMPVMGAWVVTEYRPDDIVVMRRNPYFWKVDESGQQLPYLDEMHYRLSTWQDRDVQAAAGTGDYSNLEQPESYVETLARSAEPDAPTRLEFGTRTIAHMINMNFSANGWGEPDERAQAVRELNRNLDFRIGVTSALDRLRIGESLVKGPFTAIYPGGLYRASAFYDNDATYYFPYDLDVAREHFRRAGLEDTDGNGWLNFPEGVNGGRDVEIVILADSDMRTGKNLAEAVIAILADVGLKVLPNFMGSNEISSVSQSGRFDWYVWRGQSELITVVQNTQQLAPIGPQTSLFHRAGPDGTLDLLPFEQELVDIVNAFIASDDPAERVQLMSDYQRIFTSNVYSIGLTTYTVALMVNKRFSNLPIGTPLFMFNWGEDSVMRERMFVPLDRQATHELFPQTLPGAPGQSNRL
jgi:peptide/nickel transport system substrate-binding protein